MRVTMDEGFKLFGQVLRLPVFIIGIALWTIYIFPIILAFTVLVIVGHAILVPLAYPIAYALAAFSGEKQPPRWEDYWRDYPTAYVKWLRVGYDGMLRWLSEGSSS